MHGTVPACRFARPHQSEQEWAKVGYWIAAGSITMAASQTTIQPWETVHEITELYCRRQTSRPDLTVTR